MISDTFNGVLSGPIFSMTHSVERLTVSSKAGGNNLAEYLDIFSLLPKLDESGEPDKLDPAL